MLYCVNVDNSRSFGFNEIQVDCNFHLIDVDSEEELEEYVWQMRCDTAQNQGDQETECQECGNSDITEDECENCGSEEIWEEEWSEFVEKNSNSEIVKYDPTNHSHALLRGYENSRPEHQVAVETQAYEKHKTNLLRVTRTVSSLEMEILKLQEKLKVANKIKLELLCGDS